MCFLLVDLFYVFYIHIISLLFIFEWNVIISFTNKRDGKIQYQFYYYKPGGHGVTKKHSVYDVQNKAILDLSQNVETPF